MWLSRILGHGTGSLGATQYSRHECTLSRVSSHPDMTVDVASQPFFSWTALGKCQWRGAFCDGSYDSNKREAA